MKCRRSFEIIQEITYIFYLKTCDYAFLNYILKTFCTKSFSYFWWQKGENKENGQQRDYDSFWTLNTYLKTINLASKIKFIH